MNSLALVLHNFGSIIAVSGIEGSVSGIPLTIDSGKRKILLLKGKGREGSQVWFSCIVLPSVIFYTWKLSYMLKIPFLHCIIGYHVMKLLMIL